MARKKQKAIDLLTEFISKTSTIKRSQAAWLYGKDMEVYVRKRPLRVLNDHRQYVTLDIANVTVYNKGQGQFTRFLEEAHLLNPWEATYLENILDPRLQVFVLRQGFTQHKGIFPLSYYKIKRESS